MFLNKFFCIQIYQSIKIKSLNRKLYNTDYISNKTLKTLIQQYSMSKHIGRKSVLLVKFILMYVVCLQIDRLFLGCLDE
jgi:pyrimidine operon attenuation protein/uracil phosphoribosyltransferase